MRRLPPLRAIQAFEAFGRHGSVTEAAIELGVTKGAVSQQIRKAEETIGLRLLERNGKNLEFTSWGRLYHAELTRGFEQIRAAQDVLERVRSDRGIVVSCVPSLSSKWIGPQLFDWQASQPGAQVRLIGTDEEPRRGEDPVDFRISYGERVRGFDHHTELFTDWVVPACSPGMLAKASLTEPADILSMPLLSIEWDSEHQAPPNWSDWAVRIGAAQRETTCDFAFSLSSAAIGAAINGRGFVLGQLSLISDDITAGRLVIPFDIRLRLRAPYFLAWDRAALEKPFGAELRAWITAIGRRQGHLSAAS